MRKEKQDVSMSASSVIETDYIHGPFIVIAISHYDDSDIQVVGPTNGFATKAEAYLFIEQYSYQNHIKFSIAALRSQAEFKQYMSWGDI